MHDLRLVRDNPDALREGMRRRGQLDALAPLLDQLGTLESQRRATIRSLEAAKAERNVASHEVAKRKKAGVSADDVMEASRALGTAITAWESQLGESEAAIEGILLQLPNITHADVPEGDASANKVVRSWGSPRDSTGVKPHWEVGAALGILDLERGAKVAGSGFIVFRGAGARLQRTLISFMLDVQTREFGYDETWVPLFVNRESMVGTGQLPKFEDDMYALRDDTLWAVPTAEVPLTNLVRDEILDAERLPMALTAYSACFRREAGSAGKDTRGLLRVHQFDKVEIVRLCAPEDSPAQHELLTGHAEAILQRLGVPYRVVLLAAGDTGFASTRTYDLEIFAPGVGKWLEISSCSNFGDFQARRANIRYRPGKGEKPRFVHTLNGSGLALPRLVATLLEHYQNPDGSVTVPDALRPYFGADVIR